MDGLIILFSNVIVLLLYTWSRYVIYMKDFLVLLKDEKSSFGLPRCPLSHVPREPWPGDLGSINAYHLRYGMDL